MRSEQGRRAFRRKLGLLWALIQNGTLTEGSVLFWDEPETNLNPELFDKVVRVLLELQRTGVQVFIATHNYVLLKQLDLQASTQDAVEFHALYFEDSGAVVCRSVDSYRELEPNAIAAAYDDLYDREIERTMRGDG